MSPRLLSIRQGKTEERTQKRRQSTGIFIQTHTRSPRERPGPAGTGAPYYTMVSKLILRGASPLGLKASNSDNKPR